MAGKYRLCGFISLVLVAAMFSAPAVVRGSEGVLPNVSGVTGAVIDESKIKAVYHVDCGSGDDKNSGADAANAFASLTKTFAVALDSLKKGVPTKILIHQGIYREAVSKINFATGKARDTLFVIEGEKPDAVILEGSDVFEPSSWKKVGKNLYVHDWPHDFGNFFLNNANQSLLGHRSEMVFVNGKPLRPAIIEDYLYINGNRSYKYRGFLSPELSLAPGTFGVAERNENGNKLYLRPSLFCDFPKAVIETTVRQKLLHLHNKNNLVIRNLVFRRVANSLRETPLCVTNDWPKRLSRDSFNGAISAAWKVRCGNWAQATDHIKMPGHSGSNYTPSIKVYGQTKKSGLALSLRNPPKSKNIVATLKTKAESEAGGGGIAFSVQEDGSGYAFLVAGGNKPAAMLYALQPGADPVLLDTKAFYREKGEYCRLHLVIVDDKVSCKANGVEIFSRSDLVLKDGRIGLATIDTKAMFDDFRVSKWGKRPHNLLLENCAFLWNSSVGMRLYRIDNVTVRNCRFNYNGYSGMTAGSIRNMVLEGCETNFNNWRGFFGNWLGRFIAGSKQHNMNNQVVRGHLAFGNLTMGLWYDIHCRNIKIEELVSVFNMCRGCYFELSAGPFQLSKSLIASNNKGGQLNSDIVRNVTIDNCILHADVLEQTLSHKWAPRRDSAWLAAPYPADTFVVNNSILSAPKSAAVLVSELTAIDKDDYRYQPFMDSYRGGDGNLYFGKDPRHAFRASLRNMNRRSYSVKEWTRLLGEKHSRWGDPRFVSSEDLDFRLQPGSPMIGRNNNLKTMRIPDKLVRQADEFFAWAGWKTTALPTRGKVRALAVFPPSGSFGGGMPVRLATATTDATIRYTLDGSKPAASSPRYTKPIVVGNSAVLRAIALKKGLEPSAEIQWIAKSGADTGKVEILPYADTYVRAGIYADVNFGKEAVMEVKMCANADYQRETYLSFDLDGVTGKFSRAVLRIYCISPVKKPLHLYLVNSTHLREEELTYNNRPKRDKFLASFSSPKRGAWIELDLSKAAIAALGKTLTVRIAGKKEQWIKFSTREACADKIPRLILTRRIDK